MNAFGNTPFKDRLKTLLDERDIKPSELARKLGVSRSLVSLWLTGKREPTFESKDELCNILGIDYYQLHYTPEELAKSRLDFLFNRYNLDAEEFDVNENLEKELGLKFLEIIHKYHKGNNNVR